MASKREKAPQAPVTPKLEVFGDPIDSEIDKFWQEMKPEVEREEQEDRNPVHAVYPSGGSFKVH